MQFIVVQNNKINHVQFQIYVHTNFRKIDVKQDSETINVFEKM